MLGKLLPGAFWFVLSFLSLLLSGVRSLCLHMDPVGQSGLVAADHACEDRHTGSQPLRRTPGRVREGNKTQWQG